jgi:hypothetical protein
MDGDLRPGLGDGTRPDHDILELETGRRCLHTSSLNG